MKLKYSSVLFSQAKIVAGTAANLPIAKEALTRVLRNQDTDIPVVSEFWVNLQKYDRRRDVKEPIQFNRSFGSPSDPA